MRNSIQLLVTLLISTTAGLAHAQTWQPPIGIPAPTFGITQTAPPLPNPWTANVPGFYYVQQGGGNSGNGFPASPRGSIPSSLPAGAVVIVSGTYGVNHSGSPLTLNGTATAPVFIRGVSDSQRATITQKWEVSGSYYVLEYLNATWANSSSNGKLNFSGHHGVVRHSNFRGDTNTGVGGVNPSGNNHVIWNNVIHDMGDVNADFDQDNHCIKIGFGTNTIWIVDNEIARCSGDGIQLGDGGSASQMATLHHIYVGRNNLHSNKQSGVWSKTAQDVIVSQNDIHDHVPSGSSSGQCTGGQYGPTFVWFLFNRMHNCLSGIRFEGDSGFGAAAPERFVIGNVIHAIDGNDDPENPHAAAAITIRGGSRTSIVNNTLWDYQAGIKSPSSGPLFIENNVLGGRNAANNYDVFVEASEQATASTFRNNIVDPDGFRARWASGATAASLAAFQSASGKGQASRQVAPGFVDPAGANFDLLGSSPAIDGGIVNAAYATFQGRYGIDIARDAAGRPRPQSIAYDVGAFEFGGGATSTPPPTTTPPSAARVLQVTPTSLSFSSQVGVTPPSQTLTVANGGGGTLAWTATGSPGVTVSPTSGTGAGAVTVSVNVSGLPEGATARTVTLTSAGAQGSPATVPVTITLRTTSSPPPSSTPPGGSTVTVPLMAPSTVAVGQALNLSSNVTGTGIVAVEFAAVGGPGIGTYTPLGPAVTRNSPATYTFQSAVIPTAAPRGDYRLIARARRANGTFVDSAPVTVRVTGAR
jgi:hypothetical protein